MKRAIVWSLVVTVFASFVACTEPPEKKPVGPVSNTSQMPWNRPQPNEGQAAFGGALQRR